VSQPRVLRLHPDDSVAVAVTDLAPGARVRAGGETVAVADAVPAGHKVALRPIQEGEAVVKYGYPIGRATAGIEPGRHVHTHNLVTGLGAGPDGPGAGDSRSLPAPVLRPSGPGAPLPRPDTFDGYRRTDGRVGTRNEIWVVNTVGCVNTAAERIARRAAERLGDAVDGVFSFSHPYGCSQLGDDLRNTQRVLAGLLRHPNAGGVLVLGLGCESNRIDGMLALADEVYGAGAGGDRTDRSRLRSFDTQDVLDEEETGVEAVLELARRMEADRRETCPVSDLVLGHKCGGSDGFSGISANPLVGRIADRATAAGGRVILTEVPEMFGAEHLLVERAASPALRDDVTAMIEGFKDYFRSHGQPIHENPSPGNLDGGITTLEEKSLGAVQKGGRAPVTRVLRYGEPLGAPAAGEPAPGGGDGPAGGLALLEAPGNDGVSSTALVVSGATVLLFTTGRGTPLGFPAPTLKIASNDGIAERKPHWIDFSAGPVLSGSAGLDGLADQLWHMVVDVASGRRRTQNEIRGYREIAIWKEGVTL
jgi:altronate hydrolase